MNKQQNIVFGIDEDGVLHWSKLTDAGIASEVTAPDDMWTDWLEIFGADADAIVKIVCRELGIA